MSLLYKDGKDVSVKVITTFKDGNLILEFEADCGKFGTYEALDSYTLTPAQLLDILQENECLEHAMEQDAQDLSLEGTNPFN